MREILIKKKVYKFEELKKEIQNKIIEHYSDFWQENFEMLLNDWTMDNFPSSDLKWQYSLCGCQGDGFNFYGNIDFSDVVEKIKFTDFEKEILNELGGCFSKGLEKEQNWRYCYSMAEGDSFGLDEILDNIEWNFKKNSGILKFNFADYEKLIKKIKDFLREFFANAEKKIEQQGYDILYPTADELIVDGFFDEDEFFENGDAFREWEV